MSKSRVKIQGLTCLLAEPCSSPVIGRCGLAQTLAPSVHPLAIGRGADKNKEGLTWPSLTSPTLPCFACPQVEMPPSMGGKEQTQEWAPP